MNIPAKASSIRVDRRYFAAADTVTLSPLRLTGIIRYQGKGRAAGITHPYSVTIWPEGRLPGRADRILTRSRAAAQALLMRGLTPQALSSAPISEPVSVPRRAAAEPITIISSAGDVIRNYEAELIARAAANRADYEASAIGYRSITARRPSARHLSPALSMIADFAAQSALTLIIMIFVTALI